MDMQGALRARLVASAALQALVGDRIHWMDRPQGDALPSITLQTVSRARDQGMSGFFGLQSARIQCDIWAETYAVARQITEIVVGIVAQAGVSNGIRFGRAFFENEQDLAESQGTATIHRTRIDLLVWHQAA